MSEGFNIKNNYHQSVLLESSVEALELRPTDYVIDGTFGRGGHAKLILEKLGPEGLLIGIDKDPEAIEYGQNQFANEIKAGKLKLIQGSFGELKNLIPEKLLGKINAVFLDLGVSSPQLDNPSRGMSFMKDGPLDMRMDISSGQTVEDLLKHISESALADILFQYGEEKFSRRIAGKIIKAREAGPISSTLALADIIKHAIPAKFRDPHKHPATRSFQALRIFINKELEDLDLFLDQIEIILAPGGRLGIISFHSLEDRRVKQFFNQKIKSSDVLENLKNSNTVGLSIKDIQALRQLSALKHHGADSVKLPKWYLVAKKIKPTEEEIAKNTRARSALLRVGVYHGGVKN